MAGGLTATGFQAEKLLVEPAEAFAAAPLGVLVDDHGNDAATSTPVAVASTTAGDLEVAGDIDWFRFFVTAGASFSFQAVLGTLPDSTLTLYDIDGTTPLVSNDDAGGTLSSWIPWTAPASGIYYLEVGGFGGLNSGTYDLFIRRALVVDDTGDESDAFPGDSVCDTGLGTCTLRAAIEESNATLGIFEAIAFDIPGPGPHGIAPTTALPDVTDPVWIDGATEPDYLGEPVVAIAGGLAGAGADGLHITAGFSTVRGLNIQGFSGDGIELADNGSNTIRDNFIGTNVLGTLDRGNGAHGVRVSDVTQNVIAANLISGNDKSGVFFFGANANANRVDFNRIGTNFDGTTALGNDGFGVWIADGSNNQLLGNLVSGNARSGVIIQGATASLNSLLANRIGTNDSGDGAVPNGGIGLFLIDAHDTTIGSAIPFTGNLISGNARSGLVIQGSAAQNNVIRGNTIGLAANINTDLGNASYGVWLLDAPNNTVGGLNPGERNTISGNDRNGVVISGVNAGGNSVAGNYIGTDGAGLAIRGNTGIGVWIASGAVGNFVDDNVISNNGKHGVLISENTAVNLVRGNLIGTGSDGASIRGNGGYGVWVLDNQVNEIGGTGPGEGNVISNNGSHGVVITRSSGAVLYQNLIGTDQGQTLDRGNAGFGVWIDNANSNAIGSSFSNTENVIVANGKSGVQISGAGSTGNIVLGNRIGTNAALSPLGNLESGVRILGGASGNAIGGTAPGAENMILYNGGAGVRVFDDSAGNRITQNAIGSNGGLGIDLGPLGATPNDPGDVDPGANNRQNSPQLLSAVVGGGALFIDYQVDSTPVSSSAYPLTVELFVDDGSGEGLIWFHTDTYAAPGVRTVVLPGAPLPSGTVIVATATDANGNTSEFSAGFTIVTPLPIDVIASDLDDDPEKFLNATDAVYAELGSGA